MQIELLERLAAASDTPCVTISMNTHRTHPESKQDHIGLKNLVERAKDQLLVSNGKRDIVGLLEKMDGLESEIDENFNLDSLHIFLSNSTKEIVKSPWPVEQDELLIADRFAIKPLIKILNRTENYLILLVHKEGIKLFHAINNAIAGEIRNDDFPFLHNLHYLNPNEHLGDAKQADNKAREYMNKLDKAVLKTHYQNTFNCIVISTEENYNRLMQVADKPGIYLGWVNIKHNDTGNHTLAADAWEVIKSIQQQRRIAAIEEMAEAVGQGNVITDLSEIYKAAKEGRGDLLITHNDFKQAVRSTGPFSIELTEDASGPDIIDDIVSEIAWDVTSKKGRAMFIDQEEMKLSGDIALKLRY